MHLKSYLTYYLQYLLYLLKLAFYYLSKFFSSFFLNHKSYILNHKSLFSSRKIRKFTIILPLALLLSLFFIFRSKEVAAWFNDGWFYRKAITFNNSGGAVTNQKVKLDVNTANAVDPETINFNTTDLTFTPNMAKRNSVNIGTTAPFAAGILTQGILNNTTTTPDYIFIDRGTNISNLFYNNIDYRQGTISFWLTLEEIPTTTRYILDGRYNGHPRLTISNTSISFNMDNTVSGSASVTWQLGTTYHIVISWDTLNTLNGTNYLRISVNDTHTFSDTSTGNPRGDNGITIGSSRFHDTLTSSANALIEGLTIYRRPLFDGTYGINTGNGDEITQIYNSGVGQDPTLITGSWDVVFALPTNASTGSLGVGGTGSAWSHPHASNLLYTSTTNTGGFMMAGTASTDNWISIGAGGTEPTIATLATSEKIYSGGYKITSDDITANQGIGSSKPGQTAGQNYVIRALAHSDGTAIPKVQIWDNTNNAEITSFTGTVGSGRTAPNTMIFTFELPTVARNGVASDSTNFEIRLLNTETSGTVYWHQVEVLVNIFDNPSLEIGSTASGYWFPSGWTTTENANAGDTTQELTSIYSGLSAIKFTNQMTILYDHSGTLGNFYSLGSWARKSSGGNTYMSYVENARANDGYTSNLTRLVTGDTYSHYKLVFRKITTINKWVRLGVGSTATAYFDDIYSYNLENVSLNVTPASLANSTESTGIRIDGADTATAPISNLTATSGSIKFQYTPRHSAADSNKFVESGAAADDVYLGEWYGDSDDFIKLYWDSANTLMLKYSMAGVGSSATYNATDTISAGTTYPIEINYTGGGNMTLGIGATSAITLSSIPASFGTAPTTAYWGTNAAGTGQADATFAQTSVTGVKMKSNCDDVRFTDQHGNLLEYYYDSTNGVCNAESTDFYVLMPNINSGQNTVYMYYGNSNAEKGSKDSNFTQTTFSQSATIFATEEQGKAPIAYWSLDEGQGDVVHNSAADPTLAGTRGVGDSAPTWQTEDMCIFGKCLKFDGNDYIDIGSTARDVQTVSFWVKPTTNSQSFINFDNSTHYISVTSGTVSTTGFASPAIYVNAKRNGTLTANNWNHIEITTETAFDATTIKLGQQSTNFLTGFMDEIKLFNYARSAAEIKTDFNSRGTPKGESVGIRSQSAQIGTITGPLSEGLVGYWKMDEASWDGTADEVIDYSGNNNHGVGVGDTKPTTGAGKFGNGGNFLFNGISVTNNNLTMSTNFTLSAWLYPTSSDSFDSVMNRSNKTILKLVNGKPTLVLLTGGSTTIVNFSSDSTIPTNEWSYVTAVIENNTAHLYINGNLSKSSSTTGQTVGNNTSSWSISTTYVSEEYEGKIDETRIYNRALSPQEVQDLYNWAPGPVGYWKLDEGIGTTAYDSSGNSKSGTLGGNGTGTDLPSWTSGKYGKACKFDGSDDYIEVANDSLYKFGLDQSFTLNAWINTTQGSGNRIVATKYQDTGTKKDWGLRVENGIAKFHLRDSAGTTTNVTDTVSMNDGNWHYLSVIRDTTVDKLYFYKDGILVDSETDASASGYDNDGTLKIGYLPGQPIFDGKIDDVRIYNYARTQKQIIEDMNGGGPALRQPIAHYKFDKGSGTTINNSGFGDTSLNGTLGTGSSAPTWTPSGKLNRGLSFDGINDYLSIGGTASNTQSLSFWVKPSGITNNHFLSLSSSVNVGATSNTLFTNGITSPTIYINGKTTTSLVDNTWQFVSIATGTTFTANNIHIGQNSTNFFTGLLDEFKLFNYELTKDEVNQDYNQAKTVTLGSLSTESAAGAGDQNSSSREFCIPGDTATCTPPVANWTFNEGVGSTAFDTSGNDNHGTFGTTTAAPSWTKGKIGKGLKFDGTNDYVNANNVCNDIDSGSVSVCAWIKHPTAYQSGSTRSILFRLADAPSSNDVTLSFGDYINAQNTGKLTLRITGGASLAGATDSWSTNTWYYVCGTFSTTDGMKVYINGKIDGSNATTTRGSTAATEARIGMASIGTAANFNGLIDDVKIFNYARTPAQIMWDYNRGKSLFHYKLDECQGTTIYNSTKNANNKAAGNNGTLTIGVTEPQTGASTCTDGSSASAWYNGKDGKYSASLNFDGIDDYIDVGDISRTDIRAISFWLKPDSTSESILELSASDSIAVSSGTISTTGFGTETIYVDGKLSSTLPDTNWHHIVIISSSNINANDVNFAKVSSTYYQGQLDDLQIFNYGLTKEQILTLKNRGAVSF